MYIVPLGPYTCYFISIEIIMYSINFRGNQMLTTFQYQQLFHYNSHNVYVLIVYLITIFLKSDIQLNKKSIKKNHS